MDIVQILKKPYEKYPIAYLIVAGVIVFWFSMKIGKELGREFYYFTHP